MPSKSTKQQNNLVNTARQLIKNNPALTIDMVSNFLLQSEEELRRLSNPAYASLKDTETGVTRLPRNKKGQFYSLCKSL